MEDFVDRRPIIVLVRDDVDGDSLFCTYGPFEWNQDAIRFAEKVLVRHPELNVCVGALNDPSWVTAGGGIYAGAVNTPGYLRRDANRKRREIERRRQRRQAKQVQQI